MAVTKSDKQALTAIRAGVDIFERLVTALERIAAHTAPEVIVCDEQQSKFDLTMSDADRNAIREKAGLPRLD